MPSIVRNPARALPRVKIAPSNYRKLAAYGAYVVAQMTGNASFTTPIPALSVLTGHVTDLQDAIAALGTKNNKGPASAPLNAKSAALQVLVDLQELAAYVNQTATIASGNNGTEMRYIVATSGFAPRSVRSKIDTMQQVQRLTLVNTRKHPMSNGYIQWKKPTGLFTGVRASSYQISIGGVVWGNVTKTKFQLPTVAANQTVTVTPVSPRGNGLPASIIVTRQV